MSPEILYTCDIKPNFLRVLIFEILILKIFHFVNRRPDAQPIAARAINLAVSALIACALEIVLWLPVSRMRLAGQTSKEPGPPGGA
jgi:hypothetical protein